MFLHWQLVLMFLLLQIFLSFCELRASGKFLNDKSQELKESDQIIVDNKTFSDYWQWLKIKYSFGRRQEFVKRLLPSLVIPQNKSSKRMAFDNHLSDMSSRSTNRKRRLLTLDTGADKYAPLLKTSAKKSKHHRRFLSKIRKKLHQYVNKAADWGLSNKEAAEIFEKYNRCLEEKLNALQTEEFPIKPIMAIEGEKITMDCLICYRPDVDELSQKAAWQVLKHEHTELEDVREGKEMEISKTNTLTIRNIDVNDAGECYYNTLTIRNIDVNDAGECYYNTLTIRNIDVNDAGECYYNTLTIRNIDVNDAGECYYNTLTIRSIDVNDAGECYYNTLTIRSIDVNDAGECYYNTLTIRSIDLNDAGECYYNTLTIRSIDLNDAGECYYNTLTIRSIDVNDAGECYYNTLTIRSIDLNDAGECYYNTLTIRSIDLNDAGECYYNTLTIRSIDVNDAGECYYNTLTIRSIYLNDAGQYFCVEHQDYAAVYQVDVFLTDRRKHISHGVDVPQGDTYLTQRNLRVFTMWAPWGECNTCDRPGHKFRVGQCTVKTIYSDTPVFPRDYPILMFYKDGVPCHSTALPRHIRQIPEIGERFSETIVASCNESCPTQPPAIEITDKSGQVIDVIEPGFHSIHQKPALPPLIKRKVLYEPQNSHLVLHCPGELEVGMIHWTRGERQIDPGSIKRQTRGRVHVDSRNQLHINQLLISDTAVYK
nr:Ig-like V-type domain-containing protein FAM187A isoform X3 [Biomphalaria glabrata]